MGGSSGGTSVVYPQTQAQPTAGQSAREWADALPLIYDTQLKYAPMQAQQMVDLANQYAGKYGTAMKDAQDALYPKTSAIQEDLANQVLGGMSNEVPDWMKKQYQDNMNANLGTNAGSPVGADYASRGLMQLNKDWGDYYRNLGLSVTGRQPLTQAITPSTSDYMSNFTPTSVMGMNASTYGSYVNAARPFTTEKAKGMGWQDWLGAAGSAAAIAAAM